MRVWELTADAQVSHGTVWHAVAGGLPGRTFSRCPLRKGLLLPGKLPTAGASPLELVRLLSAPKRSSCKRSQQGYAAVCKILAVLLAPNEVKVSAAGWMPMTLL